MILVNKRKESVFSVLDLDAMAENESKVAKPYKYIIKIETCVCMWIKLLLHEKRLRDKIAKMKRRHCHNLCQKVWMVADISIF